MSIFTKLINRFNKITPERLAEDLFLIVINKPTLKFLCEVYGTKCNQKFKDC